MKEINLQNLKVGDVVYNSICVNEGWTNIGTYYRKEVVKRITPKRTKIITDYGDYKSSYKFYEYSEEMEEINKETVNKKRIYRLGHELENLILREKKYIDMKSDKAARLLELLEEAADILKVDEKK